MDADIIVDALTARSVTELKKKVSQSLAKKKEESGMMQQMQQTIEQLQQQLQQMGSENKQLSNKVEELNEAKLAIDKERMQKEIELGWFKARTEQDYRTADIANEEKKTQIEVAQLYDGNPHNNEIRNS